MEKNNSLINKDEKENLICFVDGVNYCCYVYQIHQNDRSPDYFWYGVYFERLMDNPNAKCQCKLLHDPKAGDNVLARKASLMLQNLGLVRVD